MADQPAVEKEVTNAIREASRGVRSYISRRTRLQREKRRLNIFNNYLPVIAEFAMRLSESKELPNVAPLLKAVNTSHRA